MVKLAFQSYLSAIHPRNIKEAKKTMNYFWIIYWCVLYPIIIFSINEDEDSKGQFLVFLCIIKLMPIGLMLWSNVISKFMMPKPMYLSPMTFEDRKEYINAVLLIKIGVPVVLGIVLDIILSIIFEVDIVRMFLSIFAYLSMGIAIYFCVEGMGKNDMEQSLGIRMPDGTIKHSWLKDLMVGFAVGLLILFALNETMDERWNLISVIACGILTTGLLILDIYTIKTQYISTIEGVSDYEANFHIRAEVPKSQNVTFDLFAKRKK